MMTTMMKMIIKCNYIQHKLNETEGYRSLRELCTTASYFFSLQNIVNTAQTVNLGDQQYRAPQDEASIDHCLIWLWSWLSQQQYKQIKN